MSWPDAVKYMTLEDVPEAMRELQAQVAEIKATEDYDKRTEIALDMHPVVVRLAQLTAGTPMGDEIRETLVEIIEYLVGEVITPKIGSRHE